MNFLIGLVIFCFQISHAAAPDYQNGDIIFQESQSNQSKAIREATKSRWSHVGILFLEKDQWFVAEAVQPVRMTPLRSFIARGKNRDFRVYRLPGLREEQALDLKQQSSKFLGQNYDLYFEWSDDLIYCSELVYKTYLKATGVEIGKVQRYRDLSLSGPYVKALIKRRLVDEGRALNLDESIVTPATQMEDADLILIEAAGE